jgi:hypothetical protein
MRVIPREVRRITYSTKIRKLKQKNFSSFQKSVIIGSILGDGSLEWNWSRTNMRLKLEHSEKNRDYLFWKYRILKNWVLTPPKYRPINKSFSFKTISHPEITKLGKIFLRDGKKIIPELITEFIKNPIILAVWFMDDGNVIKRNKRIYGYHLNTQAFTEKENQLIVNAFKQVYEIEVKLENNHKNYRIRIMKRNSREKFQNLIKDYLLDSMRYKIG